MEGLLIVGLGAIVVIAASKKSAAPTTAPATNATAGLGGSQQPTPPAGPTPAPTYGSDPFGTLGGWIGKLIGAAGGQGSNPNTQGSPVGDYGGNSGTTGQGIKYGSGNEGDQGPPAGGGGPGVQDPYKDGWKDPFASSDTDDASGGNCTGCGLDD